MNKSPQQVCTLIDCHSTLNTTAETYQFLKRRYTDGYILESINYCSIGNRMALESLLSKSVVAKYGIEDKERLDESTRED